MCVGELIYARMSRPKSQLAIKQVINDTPLRRARTCYDHLAGVAGVTIFKGMIEKKLLKLTNEGKRDLYELTPKGIQILKKLDVNLAALEKTKRRIAYGCPDWTEDSDHLGGALGNSILSSLESMNFIKKRENRIVSVLKPIEQWFGGNSL